ncbi:hypothetical protein WUBG_00390 [Wuchereria bancrofti]|uniref:Uncharacterized protein n=1 Tax=Wuchereria bancrofti TaxID=6293 RepID=J9FMV2_WUCBA|nr:hypothetical protein WUBG_00390 [Wuchereria bancrofti]
MQLIMESTPFSRSDHQGQLSWTQLLQASKNRRVTENSFHSICEAYKRVDKCLEECEKNPSTVPVFVEHMPAYASFVLNKKKVCSPFMSPLNLSSMLQV